MPKARPAKDQSGGWSLAEFSDTLRRQGEQREAEMQAFLRKARADMPAQIAALPAKSDEELLDLFQNFLGGRADPRETEMRAEFCEHVKTEILKRMAGARPTVKLPLVGKRSI